MAEEVTLPQLGESVTEGTITAWLKNEGDHVEEDEPLYEISTEKIDTEVPSPATGVLKEIRAQVDDTVEVGEVVAVIETDADAAADTADDAEAEESAAEEQEETATEPDRDEDDDAEEEPEDADEAEGEPEDDDDAEAEPEDDEEAEAEPEDETPPAAREGDGEATGELLSPIVRRMVREHDLDPSRIEGTGQGGRITREDVERAIESGERPAAQRTTDRPAAAPAARKPRQLKGRQRTEKLSRVRKVIAQGMWDSLQTTAQLTAGIEVDVTGVMAVRARVKDAFQEREGVPLSPLPFFARAVCMALPRHPTLNAAIDIENGTATYYEFVNLGIAVDAEQGLIVPNIKNADDLTIPALARAIDDIADRTRSRKLQPDEVAAGTFTITNTGSRGVLFDTPILNPPEVAILATPKIEKRPVVVPTDDGDGIAIRFMTYLCLTYDHRMVDGADAARFLNDLKETLETHDWENELGA